MIKPTIGRVVLTYGYMSNGSREHPAIINRVWGDTMINLTMFPNAGSPKAFGNVQLFPDEAAAKEAIGKAHAAGIANPHPVAYWMPYQVGQAAKAEALEAKLADKEGA